MSTTPSSFWTRRFHSPGPNPLKLQAVSVLNDIKQDLHWSLNTRQPSDAVLRYLRISNRVNTLWGCLKNAEQFTTPVRRTAEMHTAALEIAREAVHLAAECELRLKAERQAAAEKDWFEAVESEAQGDLHRMDDLAQQRDLQALRKHDRQVHADRVSWGVRLLLVAAALAALSALAGCGGGGGDPEVDEEATVPVPQNLCAANPKVCI